ncbi:MAG: phage protease [Pseudomonadota bacterium]
MFTALKSTGNPASSTFGVSACFALGELTAEAAPKGKAGRVMLMPAGEFRAKDGRGPWDAGDLANMQQIVERTRAYHGETALVVDYEHQTLLAAKNGKPAPAAGWIKGLTATKDGIMADVEWTEAAAEAIRAGEYRYTSPVFSHPKSGTGPVGVILHSALTNSPALDMEAVALSAATLFSLLEPETDMNKELLKALGLDAKADDKAALAAATALTNTMAKIGEALGLDDDASGDDVAEAVTALKANQGEALKALGLDDDVDAASVAKAVKTAVTALKAKAQTITGEPDPTKYVPFGVFKELQDQVTALRTEHSEGRAETAVDDAIKAKKLTPGQRDWAISYCKADPEGFANFVGGAPELLSSQTVDPATKPGGKKGAAHLDETEIAMCKQLNITPEDFVKSREQLSDQGVSAL